MCQKSICTKITETFTYLITKHYCFFLGSIWLLQLYFINLSLWTFTEMFLLILCLISRLLGMHWWLRQYKREILKEREFMDKMQYVKKIVHKFTTNVKSNWCSKFTYWNSHIHEPGNSFNEGNSSRYVEGTSSNECWIDK